MMQGVYPRTARRSKSGKEARIGQGGITLVELLISLIVLGVLSTLAAPSFVQTLNNYRVDGYGNSFVGAARLARAEAIKRNTTIRLCASADGTACATDGKWELGWIMVLVTPSGTQRIQRQEALTGGYEFRATSGTSEISFDSSGFGATSATFKVSRPATTTDRNMGCISVSATAIASYKRTARASACP